MKMGASLGKRSIKYEGLELLENGKEPSKETKSDKVWRKIILIAFACVIIYCSITMFLWLFGLVGTAQAAELSPTKVPQYFQTTPELWAGPTATGRAPFLAQTNPVSFAPTATFVPNNPLETAQPIVGGVSQNESIFQLMGQLSPYFSNPSGFGVSEYPLPPGANITQVQVSSTSQLNVFSN